MAEYNNTPNTNNRPNGANPVNNAPQSPQNMGNRPNPPRPSGYPSGQPNGMQSRPSNYPTGQPNGAPPRQSSLMPRPSNIPSRSSMPQGNRSMPPRQPNGMPPRPQSSNILRPGISNSQQPTNPNRPNINRPSSGERFNRGSQSLSHMNGGSSGTKLYRIERNNQGDMMRRQVGGVMLDTDLIDDANRQNLNNTKSKLKTTTIVILSILLVLSLVYLAFAIAGYFKKGKPVNCKYYISSEVSAHWIIDDNAETEFVVREGLSTGKIYEIESILVINSDDKVNIKITISAKIDGNEIFISGLDDAADNLVRVDGKNTWIYMGGHQGAGEVYLFKGIDFFGAPENLTSENVNITVNAEITKA